MSLKADGRKAAGRRWSPILAAGLLAVAASLAALAVLGSSEVPDAVAQQGAACSEGLESIMKNTDGSMACVSSNTKAVLIARGWGSEPMPAAQGDMDAMDDGSGDMDAMDDGSGDMAAMGDSAAAMEEDNMAGLDDATMPLPEIGLTDAESERLTGSKIRVAYDPYRLPIEFYAQNAGLYDNTVALDGVSGAYLGWLSDVLPADFEPVDIATLEVEPGAPIRPHEAVRAGMADVALAIEPTDVTREYMSFTEPHTTLPIVMATTGDTTVEIDTLPDMKVGAVSGYGAARWLDSMSVEYTEYPTGAEAVQALGAGDIEVFVGLWAVAFNSGIAMMPLPIEVANAGETGQSEMLSIGYASPDAELGSALAKALASSPDEIRMIADMVSMDPAEAFEDPGALSDAFGGDETVSSMIAIGDEIDELNRSSDEIKEKLGALPEAQIFKERYPGYDDSGFYDLGSFEAELTLTSVSEGASLRIDYSKETGTATFTYMCTDSDGNMQSYHSSDAGDAMADIIVRPCTGPDSG